MPGRPSGRAPCPCTSGKPYGECCGPLHRGEREPSAAEELLRSRYAGFAIGEVDYLWKTLHEDHQDRKKPKDRTLTALKLASSTLKYMGLVVIETQPKDSDGIERALYLARVFRRGDDVSFVELAEFLHDGVGLRYLAGTVKDAHGWTAPPAALTIETFGR